MLRCALDRGLEFCGACEEYPCEQVREFHESAPHRLELARSQERIRQVGWEQWFKEMLVRYACSECGAINSADDAACYVCGHSPSCPYVAEHQDTIADMTD